MGTFRVQRARVLSSPLFAVEARLVRSSGMGRRAPRLSALGLALFMGVVLTLVLNAASCHAEALDACAWDANGPTVCGPVLNGRAYLPGLTLTPDLSLFVGDSEEAAYWSMCLQHAHGVVCSGVSE